MAELTYDDVRRAAQDAVRELQGIVGGLRNNTDDIRRTFQQLNPAQSQNQLNELTNRLNMLQNQIANLDTAIRSQGQSQQNPAYALQTMHQSMVDVQRRLAAMEEFVQFIYRYFNALQQQAEENQGYRNSL